MTDDLERRLRDRLQHAALPSAPDSLHVRLTQAAAEPAKRPRPLFNGRWLLLPIAAIVAVALAGGLLVVGGRPGPTPGLTPSPVASEGIFLPMYRPLDGYPAALLQGTLVHDGGCLWIESGSTRLLVLWPSDTSVVAQGGQLVVRNAGQQAIVGTAVSAGGGEYYPENYDFVVGLIGQQVPPQCRGSDLYWLASSVEPASPLPSILPTTPTPGPTLSQAPTPEPTANPAKQGGTLYLLYSTATAGGTSFQDLDPQRIYTGEDLAFFGATIMRSLTAYVYSDDPTVATTLTPDAATDTGTHNADATQWSFTLRDNLTWQDGSPVTCADFKYGASRAFQKDVLATGPTYAIQYLDIPADPNAYNGSQYPGPYTATSEQQALFDNAVQCDGNRITYKLNQPVVDFNYTATIGFGAVPNPVDHPGIDTGEAYTNAPWSDGPYMIGSYTQGVGGSLVLVRNPNWIPSSDPYRPAYPDKWEVDFAIDPEELDQRLMQPTGNDVYALQYGAIQPDHLATIFSDPHTTAPAFAGRAFSDYDPYARFIWIDTAKVPNQQIRQAMAVALDRAAIRDAHGGDFYGDYADGVIKPNIGLDYAPTHLWDVSGPFGEDVPASGDPALARQLIAQSGESAPTLTYDYVAGPSGDQIAAIIQYSLHSAGFSIKLNAIPEYNPYGMPFTEPDEFAGAGWGADWPNASTVIPALFTDATAYGLPRLDANSYPGFYSQVQDALTTIDRTQQAAKWQALDKAAADEMFVIPTFFGLTQTIAGTGVGNLYRWAPYSSWPYGQLYVRQ